MIDSLMDLLKSILGFLHIMKSTQPITPITFALGTMVFTFLIMIIDVSIFYLYGKSFLKFNYRGYFYTTSVIIIWVICSGIVSFLLDALEFLQENLRSSLAIAVTWPTLFIRFVRQSEKDEQKI